MKKNSLISIFIAAILLVVACSKDGIMGDNISVDTKMYETTLNADYTNALQNHNAFNSNPPYYKRMFNVDDSLFSAHFYNFCIDMMKNSGMMSTTGGMMGNNSGMMGGNSGMMNGNVMGSQADIIDMMNYMDSIHVSAKTIMNPDYMKTDSLMYSQMSTCKMMTSQTEGITAIYNNMHSLRKNHRMLNGI